MLNVHHLSKYLNLVLVTLLEITSVLIFYVGNLNTQLIKL